METEVWERISCTTSLEQRRVKEHSALHEHGTRHKVSYLIHYDSLLQNATDIITKCDSYFVTKCDRSLLQNASYFLLKDATILLQNATVITNCDNTHGLCFISKTLRHARLIILPLD